MIFMPLMVQTLSCTVSLDNKTTKNIKRINKKPS
jgi:hypothetical protein